MGHDIDLMISGNTVNSTYISFNWSEFSNIFHISNIHGHSGKKGVIRKLKEAISQLKQEGYDEHKEIRIDGWGNPHKNIKLSKEDHQIEKVCMFASHLSRFLKLAEKYPSARWYSDQVTSIQSLYEFSGEEESDSEP